MYKSTLTQAYVDYLESTGKTIDEDHARGLDKILCICEKFIAEGRRDANAHKAPQTLEDMQQRVLRVADEADQHKKRIQEIATTMHAYYMIGYDHPNFKENT